MTTLKTYRNDAHVKSEKAKNVKAENIQFRLSHGNSKLGETENTKFLIWSITSDYDSRLDLVTCPLATSNCKRLCYAKKAERMYPSVNLRRHLNLLASLDTNFTNNMIEEITYQLSRKNMTGKEVLFRIHEAGDFYSKDYMRKWILIANYFKGQNIKFLAYTKSLPYLKSMIEEFNGLENININFKSSIWDDTSNAMLKLTKQLGVTVFTADTKQQIKENKDYSKYFVCPSMTSENLGCGTCFEKYKKGNCYNGTLNTVIEIH